MNVLATSADGSRLRGLRDDLDTRGVGEWERALRPETMSLLGGEARRAGSEAELVETTAYELGAGGQKMRSPMRFLAAFGGETLCEIHESDAMAELASRLAGREMRPSETAYLYFRSGDFIGLHTDLPACELTFLVPVGASAPPLVVHPELRATEPADLLELARRSSGTPEGGVAIPLPSEGLLALDGRLAPHQTRPVANGEDAIIATLCYAGRET